MSYRSRPAFAVARPGLTRRRHVDMMRVCSAACS
ncbi:hypothetical protein SAMN05443287_104183 [Micromonospora phaseoli]|uniref:Uncharacterized protein n=1 Tax=Micromonospora phaseoli TaxID=1144548 RepID=A0A1H6YI16_9ACTN|nr:hypothetical protein CLV64_103182 [Micromonospora phaseoli]SEJ39484.1 hypothetical protein SAMN05443287_104183 [Micromonospora phaseoli]